MGNGKFTMASLLAFITSHSELHTPTVTLKRLRLVPHEALI